MASQIFVSASTGVTNPLLSKLTMLLHKHAAELKAAQEEVTKVKEELSSISAVLLESAMMEEPDVQVTEWMRQVREVTYDGEDSVDLFYESGTRRKLPRSPSILAALGLQTSQLPSSPRNRANASAGSNLSAFAQQIRQIRTRLAGANERHKRYGVPVDPVPASHVAADFGSSSVVTIDPELILMQHTVPVAIEGPTKHLHQRLAAEENHATVISIVGVAGIGKTTLAMQVHRTVQEPFGCRVFVHVGRRPSVRRVLLKIISQVSRQHKLDDTMNEHQVMTELRKLLDNQRYLVIMDDIWSLQTWKAISCALPQNGLRSRIIVTTRNHDVARSCSSHPSDSIYEVKPLSDSESEKLFDRRAFGFNGKCLRDCEVHDQVLKLCCGLPLSILLVASLLVRTAQPEKWAVVHESTLSASEQYALLQGMEKILHMSYIKLPFPIKSCFLYLCVFPKNYTINRDRLICRWIAEGFIPWSGEESTWETGRSYFNELINRSLVQPVFAEDEDDPVACMVHGAIHDFITSRSSEENFVILDEELESMPRDVIRRLSLNYTKQEDSRTRSALDSDSIGLSPARSLTVLGPAQQMPPLSKFLLLRVLDLEDAENLENKNLKDIGRLFNLKYLGLGGKLITELPESIGELQYLETLEVRRTKVQKLPEAASRLENLVRILAQHLDDIPGGVEKMQQLQKVTTLRVNSDPSIKLVAKLAELGQLRSLGVKWCFRDDAGSNLRDDFVSSLNKASESHITALSIHSDDACSLGFLEMSWVPPYQLQKLVMKPSISSCLPRIPEKIVSCQGITYLEIAVNLDRENDILIISRLPALTTLKLSASGKPILISQGFGCLKVFSFRRLEDGLGLEFEADAMPLLRRLHLRFKLASQEKNHVNFECGLPHLHSLRQVIATIDCGGAKVADVVSAEEVIKQEINAHSKHPTLELNRDNEEKMVRDGAQESTLNAAISQTAV